MFSNAKVGNKVWGFSYGWGVITSINPSSSYPIEVTYPQGYDETYTYEGKGYVKDTYPTLLWDEVKFDIPPKPMPKLEVDTKLTVWADIYERYPRYFHSFTKDGKVRTWTEGRSSFSARSEDDYTIWPNWELYAENK